MRALLFLLAVLALAGCAERGDVRTLPLGVPPAEELVPREIPGFKLGYETPQSGNGGGLDGHSAVYDGPAGAKVAISVSSMDTEARAKEFFGQLTGHLGGENLTRPEVGDEAVQSAEGSDRHASTRLLVRKSTVVWMMTHDVRERAEPLVDLVEVARPLAARVPP